MDSRQAWNPYEPNQAHACGKEGGERQRQYTWCRGYVEPMPTAQHELIQPICDGNVEAPVAGLLKGHDSIGGVWGVRRPGHFFAASGAAKTAALGSVHTRLDEWMTGFCRRLHMQMVCSSCVEFVELFIANKVTFARGLKSWGLVLLVLLGALLTPTIGSLKGHYYLLQVGLVQATGMDLGTTLLTTGVYNIAMGAVFGIPLPVQPMMAIAAVALSDEGLELAEMVAAGVFVSGVVFLLGVTRLINVFNRWSLSAS